jgi:hypothetical protein
MVVVTGSVDRRCKWCLRGRSARACKVFTPFYFSMSAVQLHQHGPCPRELKRVPYRAIILPCQIFAECSLVIQKYPKCTLKNPKRLLVI